MNQTEHLAGQIAHLVYRNEETGYTVAHCTLSGGRQATLVGVFPQLAPGETIRAQGRWETDTRHGRQFRVASYEPTRPDDAAAIARYLGSGLIKGIGPSLAKAIVAHFGLQTFDILDRQPKRLREVAGIGKQKAAAILETWDKARDVREIGVLLQQAGASRHLAPRLLLELGTGALAIMKSDPFQLAGRVRGIGFLTADRIAGQLGFQAEDPARLRGGLLHAIDEMVADGNTAVAVEDAVVAAVRLLGVARELVDPQVEALVAAGRLVRAALADESVLTPPVLAATEKRLARRLRAIDRCASRFRRIKEQEAAKWVENRLQIELAPEQQEAVLAAFRRPLTVITGGPGTGKTTIVRAICEICEALERTVVLTAPTGRAAKRLGESSGRPAKTVHRLLEINPRLNRFERNADTPLEADLVVCDEASMLDVALAKALADAVARGAHLLLVGDVDQLPSVGPGNVLGDLIACPWVETRRLARIYRQAQDSRIVTNAHRIRDGRMPELAGGKDSDFFFIEEDDAEKLCELVVDLAARRLPQAYGFDPFQDIMVLAPMHRGEAGVARLNEALRARLNPAGPTLTVGERIYRLGDKVMQTANDYDNEIYNGDLGRVTRLDAEERRLVVDFDGRSVALSAADLDDLTPAYAVSVHKSQGSEYPCVVAPLHTQHYILLVRNLLYTAVTRGKRLVVLCGSRRALERAVHNDEARRRKTMLGHWLEKAVAQPDRGDDS